MRVSPWRSGGVDDHLGWHGQDLAPTPTTSWQSFAGTMLLLSNMRPHLRHHLRILHVVSCHMWQFKSHLPWRRSWILMKLLSCDYLGVQSLLIINVWIVVCRLSRELVATCNLGHTQIANCGLASRWNIWCRRFLQLVYHSNIFSRESLWSVLSKEIELSVDPICIDSTHLCLFYRMSCISWWAVSGICEDWN